MTHVRPFEPLLPAEWFTIGPLVVLAPHPDDEVLGCGGLIAAHRERGCAVHVIVMTDGGQGGAAGDSPALRERRREEVVAGLSEVGGADVTFLDVPDGRLLETQGVFGRVSTVLSAARAATLAMPSPLEVHPDHRAACLIGAAAASSAGFRGRILCFDVGAFSPSNVLLDVTRHWPRKERAIRRHASQLLGHDLVGKTHAQNRARSVNVDDRAIELCEAFAVFDAVSLPPYLAAAEALARVVDAAGPSESGRAGPLSEAP